MLRDYLKFSNYRDNPFRIISLMMLIFIALYFGYRTNNFFLSSFTSLGVFTFFYYRNIKINDLIVRLFLIGIGLLVSLVLGIISTNLLWIEPFVVGIIAFISRFILRLFDIQKPGSLFFVMLSALGASSSIPMSKIPEISIYFFSGVIICLVAAMITKLLDNRPIEEVENISFKTRFYQDPLVVIDSIFYSIALFLSVYISHGLKLHNPYWVTLSCASILLAENLDAMEKRQVQYLSGSILGLFLAAILSLFSFTQFEFIIIISLFYGISQFLVPKNYAAANIFLNPLAIMLSSLIHDSYLITFVEYRFFGIFLGSFLGLGISLLMNIGLKHYLLVLKNSFDDEK